MSSFSGDETAPFFGFLGAAAAALVFSCMGAAYGTAKSGVGVASMAVMRPELGLEWHPWKGQCATTKTLCWNDPYSYLC
ncbi:hypothetical protein J5N97_029217 [Dioscorea zingiberensis]|uniref:V-ATPase proteolipid subunit C-like domain-containing protein n=1 Tax=Dioscorea zingiberensis TaxID=325984 RepID=A0A9D5H5P2_9LILI|nr:hypothetical protein J5N97_029217 [Dioscorea zingiberensis]